MEYCDGDNLRNFINKNQKDNKLIEEKVLRNIIKQICIGIKEINDKKIVHRDLKPENLFINEKMIIKIGDFGIYRQSGTYNTQITNNKAGTYNYIAPEILKQGRFNEKSDIWSLGCIIYELFTLNIYSENAISRDIKKLIQIYIIINGKH